MRTIFVALLVLSGCVHAHSYAGPNGERMVEVSCNGAALDMGDCYTAARRECGGDFAVALQSQATNYAANSFGGNVNVTPVAARNLVVTCAAAK